MLEHAAIKIGTQVLESQNPIGLLGLMSLLIVVGIGLLAWMAYRSQDRMIARHEKQASDAQATIVGMINTHAAYIEADRRQLSDVILKNTEAFFRLANVVDGLCQRLAGKP